MRLGQAPALAVLGVVAAGLLLAAREHWRLGSAVIASAVLLAAGLRVVLTPRSAGWLVVRSRAFDAALLLLLGLAMLGLAVVIPRP